MLIVAHPADYNGISLSSISITHDKNVRNSVSTVYTLHQVNVNIALLLDTL